MNTDIHLDLYGNPDKPGVTLHFEFETIAEALQTIAIHPGWCSRTTSKEYRDHLAKILRDPNNTLTRIGPPAQLSVEDMNELFSRPPLS